MTGLVSNNPILASALASHGASAAGGGGGKITSSSSSRRSGRGRTMNVVAIRAMAVHPRLPLVAYVEEWHEGGDEGMGTKSSRRGVRRPPATTTTTTTTRKGRLVVRDHRRDENDDHRLLLHDDRVPLLASSIISMEELAASIDRYRRGSRSPGGGGRRRRMKNGRPADDVISPPTTPLGDLASVTFLDRDALYWRTRRRRGAQTDRDAMTVGMDAAVADHDGADYEDGGGMDERSALADDVFSGGTTFATTSSSSATTTMGRGTCLGLQFERVLVLVRLHDDENENDDGRAGTGNNTTTCSVMCCLEGQRAEGGSGGRGGGGGGGGGTSYFPTSAPVPVSSSVFVYGCSDGAMRFHDLGGGRTSTTGLRNSIGGGGGGRQSTIKSVRGPNGRNDPVVTILDVDPAYDDDDDDHRDGSIVGGVVVPTTTTTTDDYPRSFSDDRTLAMRSRILTACGSGVAFLWEVRVAIDRYSGMLRDLTVMPPLVRLDGLGNFTMSPRDAPGAPAPSSSSTRPPPGGFWGAAANARSRGGGASADAPYMMVTPAISYDPHRNLLTWTLPPDAPASSIDHGDDRRESSTTTSAGDRDDRASLAKWAAGNGGFVKVWDLSSIGGGDRRSAAQHAHPSSPRPPPKVPPIAIVRLPTSAASSAASSIAGLAHAAAPSASLTCVNLSRDGSRLLVHSAPLPDAVDDADDGQDGGGQSSSVSPVQGKRKKLGADGAKPSILHVNFTLLRAVPLAGVASSPSLIGTAVSASHLAPDVLTVATDRGVVHVNLDDGETSPSSGDEFKMRTACSAVPGGPVHAVISLGGVGNRPGILFVEDRVVFTSRLRATVSSNDPKLIKKVDVHDKTMVCKLQGRNPPWRMVRSTRTSTFVESLRPMNSPPRLIPSPSGRYLCLFWERERSYEILHAGSLLAREQTNHPGSATASDGRGQRVTPFVDSGTNVSSFAWVGDDDNFAILRQLDTFPIVSDANDGDLSASTNPNPFPSSAKQRRPRVELFKLAEVKIDAVELVAGASVAAATTVSLGSLTVRGGDRVIPAVLFGGPSLCVCCLSTSDRADIGDNIAYFYSRKGGAIEKNDERANTYFSIGTSIPYPDLVTWDEHGTLCAISYGYRVAVYLSDESRFILLGSVRVANSSDVQLPLLSMKFLHGVLFCSTQSSVQAIFLGNIEDNDTVCEIDAFTIATDSVPLYGMDNPDISSPAPIIAALTQPHVLAYHSGGLLVSTLTGLRLLSLSHPIVRIGTLLAANLIDRARKWIVAMPQVEHDGLAHFLIRRGHVDLAIRELNGLSLETCIDLCMRYERTDELVYLLCTRGSEVIPETCDWGRDYGKSAFLSIGVYMLGKGKIECAKKMIAQAAEAGLCELLVDAMKLATFVSVVDQPEGSALLQRVTDAMDFNINRQFALVNIL